MHLFATVLAVATAFCLAAAQGPDCFISCYDRSEAPEMGVCAVGSYIFIKTCIQTTCDSSDLQAAIDAVNALCDTSLYGTRPAGSAGGDGGVATGTGDISGGGPRTVTTFVQPDTPATATMRPTTTRGNTLPPNSGTSKLAARVFVVFSAGLTVFLGV